MKAYTCFDEWKQDQSSKNQELIDAVCSLIENIAPHLETIVKWGQGCFTDGKSPKMFIHAEPDHIQFGFYNGSTLKDIHGLLVGNGKYVRHVKIRNLDDVNEKRLSELIKQVTR